MNLPDTWYCSRGDGLFAFGNARAEVAQASIVADRARVRDGGGNTGFALR